jgi:hypothetical protein
MLGVYAQGGCEQLGVCKTVLTTLKKTPTEKTSAHSPNFPHAIPILATPLQI